MNSVRAGRAPHHWMRQVPAQPQCRLSVDRQSAANDLNGGAKPTRVSPQGVSAVLVRFPERSRSAQSAMADILIGQSGLYVFRWPLSPETGFPCRISVATMRREPFMTSCT